MPGIDQLDAAVVEVPNVARRQRGVERTHDVGHHQVDTAARPPMCAALRGNLGMRIRSGRVLGQHAVRKAQFEYPKQAAQQGVLSPTFGRMCAPNSISPRVMAVVNTSPSVFCCSPSSTFGLGTGWNTSEMTLVSSTIIDRTWAAEIRRLTPRLTRRKLQFDAAKRLDQRPDIGH